MGQTRASTLVQYSVVDSDVSRSAGLNAITMQHAHRFFSRDNGALSATPTSFTEQCYFATQTTTVQTFYAMLNVCGSATSITVDLQKNGSSILSSVITLTNSTGNRVPVSATISSPTLASGDLLEIVVTVSSATGASGLAVQGYVIETGIPV